MAEIVAETERLRLREWTEADIDPFILHTNTENVMRWLGGVKTRDFLDWVVHDRFMRWQAEHGFTFWVVERKEDGAFLGFCGLKLADGRGSSVAGEFEVGWRFREDAWGQGYAKEAAFAAIELAFRNCRAERVVALTVKENKGSWGLMRRLGMRRREDLDYVDADWPETMNPIIIYEIDRAAWAEAP